MKQIALGSKVKDQITGFTGITTGAHYYINGCLRYSIEPAVDKDGKRQEIVVIDSQNLDVLEGPEQTGIQSAWLPPLPTPAPTATGTGGPYPNPPPR